MLCLRLLIIFVLLASNKIFAAPGTFSFNSAYTQFQGKAPILPNAKQGVLTNSLRNTYSYQSSRVSGVLGSLGLVQIIPDYSNYVILDGTTKRQRSLSETESEKQEFIAAPYLQYKKGDLELSSSLGLQLGPSPFARNGGSGLISYAFLSESTKLSLELSRFVQNMPLNYFRDGDRRLRQRPTKILISQTRAFLDQILSSNLKGRLELSSAKRRNERPRQYGGELSFAYAFKDNLFAQTSFSHHFERKNQQLLDERGYFKLWGGNVSLTSEPYYDVLLTLSYALTIEREFLPQQVKTVQRGIDQYLAGIRFEWLSANWDISAMYAQSNTKDKNLGINGGLSWEI